MTAAARPVARPTPAAGLAQVAVFAALIAALSLAPAVPLGGLAVPITLQTLGVALAGLCLGPWRGGAAVALYLVVGLAGMPVFAQGRAGLGVLAGPSAGYLVAFPVAALVTGAIAAWAVRRGLTRLTPLLLFAAVLVSRVVVIWPLGAAGMMRSLGISYPSALLADLPFWVGDVIKAVIAALLATAVHRAFPRLLRR